MNDPNDDLPLMPEASGDPGDAVSVALLALDSELSQLQRRHCAVRSLQRALQSHRNQLPAGTRRAGLPILKTSVPGIDGRTQIEVIFDLKFIDPANVSHVLIPLLNAELTAVIQHKVRVGEALAALTTCLSAMIASIEKSPV